MDPGAGAHVSNLQQQDLEDRDDQKEEVERMGHGALCDKTPEMKLTPPLFLFGRVTTMTIYISCAPVEKHHRIPPLG